MYIRFSGDIPSLRVINSSSQILTDSFNFYLVSWFERARAFVTVIDPENNKFLMSLLEDFFDSALVCMYIKRAERLPLLDKKATINKQFSVKKLIVTQTLCSRTEPGLQLRWWGWAVPRSLLQAGIRLRLDAPGRSCHGAAVFSNMKQSVCFCRKMYKEF